MSFLINWNRFKQRPKWTKILILTGTETIGNGDEMKRTWRVDINGKAYLKVHTNDKAYLKVHTSDKAYLKVHTNDKAYLKVHTNDKVHGYLSCLEHDDMFPSFSTARKAAWLVLTELECDSDRKIHKSCCYTQHPWIKKWLFSPLFDVWKNAFASEELTIIA